MRILSRQQRIALLLLMRRRKGRREFGIHPILRNRKLFGEFHHLFLQLLLDPDRFFDYMRMDIESFEMLKDLLGNR
jgi:hypothetical protein